MISRKSELCTFFYSLTYPLNVVHDLFRQGQTRLARYYEDKDITVEERTAQEADIVRKCLMRGENQVYISVFDMDIGLEELIL